MKNFCWAILLVFACGSVFAQGSFYGSLQLNPDFYIRDSAIGAANTPHYDDLKNSVDGWFDLNYNNDKFQFDAGVRLDLYLNSNLHNPGTPFSAQGLGTFYMRKRFDKIAITGGYIYDQFGSGIVFRAYEDRTLGIDNAVLGAHVEYEITEGLRIKALAGVQKNRLSLYKPIVIAANVEYELKAGKDDRFQILPGVSVLNRTIDENSMSLIVNTIQTYAEEERFVPRYNTYVFGAYNTINVGGFSLYTEFAAKTHEALADLQLNFFDDWGSVFFGTATYTQKGFGVTGQFKRTENWQLRTSPNETFLNGMVAYIPPVTRQNSLRLPARYNAASQELEELSYSFDVNFQPIKKVTFNLHYAEVSSFIIDQPRTLWFREFYMDVELKMKRKWKADVGFQFMQYDQEFFEREKYGDYRIVRAFTPFAEFTYKINRKQSIRLEVQWQGTQAYTDANTGEQFNADFGNWIFILAEYSIAPWLSIAVSDMYNYKPNPGRQPDDIHYYSAFAAFTYKSTRLSLAYVKQVEGIVCTGGICRLEPAFNGVRMTLNTTF